MPDPNPPTPDTHSEVTHVAHKSDDDRAFWLTCGGEEIARLTVSDPNLAMSNLGVIQSFFDSVLQAHAGGCGETTYGDDA